MSQHKDLLTILQKRFEANLPRHKGIKWPDVEALLSKKMKLLETVDQMEATGGEPDVVVFEKGLVAYVDCALESPSGRRSLCYDREALDSRKEAKPKNSAIDMAEEMGITLLSEEQYKALQSLDSFDNKTSSWLLSPPEMRKLGGAIFGDHRFGRTFIYHNGASSYYAARGFRGYVKIEL